MQQSMSTKQYKLLLQQFWKRMTTTGICCIMWSKHYGFFPNTDESCQKQLSSLPLSFHHNFKKGILELSASPLSWFWHQFVMVWTRQGVQSASQSYWLMLIPRHPKGYFEIVGRATHHPMDIQLDAWIVYCIRLTSLSFSWKHSTEEHTKFTKARRPFGTSNLLGQS